MFGLYTLGMMFDREHKYYMEIKKQQDSADAAMEQHLKSLQWERTKLMTRIEAINKWSAMTAADDLIGTIDFFIETGMLKVEEEKSIEQKAEEYLRKYGYDASVLSYLSLGGFKIVEK